jgi:hypothetical protein
MLLIGGRFSIPHGWLSAKSAVHQNAPPRRYCTTEQHQRLLYTSDAATYSKPNQRDCRFVSLASVSTERWWQFSGSECYASLHSVLALHGSLNGTGPNSYQTVAGTVDLTQPCSARRLRLAPLRGHRGSLLSTCCKGVSPLEVPIPIGQLGLRHPCVTALLGIAGGKYLPSYESFAVNLRAI